jgi:hypothetical protein
LTPEQHNKYLAWAHLGYAGITALLMFVMMIFMGFMLRLEPNGPPPGVMVFMLLFFGFICALNISPSLIAGYGLLKRRRWAKTATIVAAVLGASSVPFGTGICVYSFWFLFSEPGKAFFEQQKHWLPPRRQEWLPINTQNEPTREYVPPSTPPDWR